MVYALKRLGNWKPVLGDIYLELVHGGILGLQVTATITGHFSGLLNLHVWSYLVPGTININSNAEVIILQQHNSK